MIYHCISSLFANFEMSRGCRSSKYDSFRTFDRDNLFQVSVCRSLRPNRDLMEVPYMLRLRETHFNFRPLQPLFTKLTKSHISTQFFVEVFVLGWYTYFETAEVLFSLFSEKRGVKTLKIYE